MLSKEQIDWLTIANAVFESANCAPLYLVGGFVRDYLLGRDILDVDLAMPGTPDQVISISQNFASNINKSQDKWHATFLILDPVNGITRVIFVPIPDQKSTVAEHPLSTSSTGGRYYFDFAAFGHATSIEEDLARRDFTINALAVPLKKFLQQEGQIQLSDVIDVSDGLKDLKNRVVRAVSERNLVEDPLRLLRGIRIKAQLSKTDFLWQIDEATLSFFAKHSKLVTQPAPERIHDEFNKILMAPDLENNLRLLDQVNILTRLLPELEEARACVQMPGHFYDVFEHTLASMDRVEWLTTPQDNFFGLGKEIMRELDRPEAIVTLWPQIIADLQAHEKAKILILRWATLLHDIGKPRTKQIDADGNIHFYEHNKVGAEMARTILHRFRFSHIQMVQISSMVQNHLRIGQLGENFDPQVYSGISDKAAFRFLKDTAPVQTGMFLLSLADHAAVDGPRITSSRGKYGWWRHLVLTDFFARKLLGPEPERVVGKVRLLDGKSLIEQLGLQPGPTIGYLLRQVEEAQAGGEISTPQEALSFARNLLDTSNFSK